MVQRSTIFLQKYIVMDWEVGLWMKRLPHRTRVWLFRAHIKAGWVRQPTLDNPSTWMVESGDPQSKLAG